MRLARAIRQENPATDLPFGIAAVPIEAERRPVWRAETMSEHSEINDVSSSSLKHIIGQKGVVSQVQVAIEAAFADQKNSITRCLSAGQGWGKRRRRRLSRKRWRPISMR